MSEVGDGWSMFGASGSLEAGSYGDYWDVWGEYDEEG